MERISDLQLYPYLVRLASVANKINEYNLKQREEYNTASTNDIKTREVITFSKLPKGTVKALMAFFKSLALGKQGTPVDPSLKRTYLAFYTQLLDLKSTDPEQLDELSVRTELLILKFTSCATKVAQNATADTQGVQFLQLLRDIVKKQGGSAQLDSQLASREAEFSTPMVSPKKKPKPMIMKQIDSDFVAEHIAKIMLVSPVLFERDLARESTISLEDVGLLERKLKASLSMDQYPMYNSKDFPTHEFWSEFVKKETSELDEFEKMFPVPSGSNRDILSSLLPPNIRAYACAFLERCIEVDLQESTLFTTRTQALIRFVFRFWRVPVHAYVPCLLFAISQLYHNKVVPVSIIDDVYRYVDHLLKDDDDPWALSDINVALNSIENMRGDVVSEIIEITKKLLIPNPPKLGPLLHALTINLPSFADLFNISETEYLVVTPQQIREIESSILASAQTDYSNLVSLIPRDSSLEVDNIIQLIQGVTNNAQKLQKRYKKPLLDCLPIAKIVCSKQITLLGQDFMPIWNFCMKQYANKDDEPLFEDIVKLHEELLNLEDLASQVKLPADAFNLNSEELLFAYFEKWALDSSSLCMKWVQPAIENDNSEPLDVSSGKLYSSAVKDLFTSFYALIALVDKMEWNNQLHLARLLTTIIGGISSALCQWAGRIHDLFTDEMNEASTTLPASTMKLKAKEQEEQWLSYAKEATAQAAAAVMARNSKPSTTFDFKRESGVKLNNIATAYEMLQSMESQLNSDTVSKRLRDFQAKQGSNPASTKYLFNVTIIGASDIKHSNQGLYLTLVDHDSRKQLGKTNVSTDGQPRWNESFEFEVGARPRLLRATVWSYGSSTADHIVCGRVMLRLDAKQYAKKEYGMQLKWIDLEANSGKIHVMFSVDQQFDDIRFYFGKALRFIKRTQDMMISNIVSKFSEFIHSVLSRQTLREVTGQSFTNSVQTGVFQLQKSFNSWLGKPLIQTPAPVTSQPEAIQDLVDKSLDPLYDYLNKNFATLAGILTPELRIEVLSRTWDVVLDALESLILPPLDSSKSTQTQLNSAEMEALYLWLSRLKEFFHSDGAGPSLERLQNENYQHIMTIPVYYDLSVQQLKSESEKVVRSSLRSMANKTEMLARQGTVMAHRNKSVIEHQTVQLKNAQRNSPRLDDIILRTLKLKGESAFIEQHMKFRERLMQRELTEKALEGSFF